MAGTRRDISRPIGMNWSGAVGELAGSNEKPMNRPTNNTYCRQNRLFTGRTDVFGGLERRPHHLLGRVGIVGDCPNGTGIAQRFSNVGQGRHRCRTLSSLLSAKPLSSPVEMVVFGL